jgi:DNA-binding GntR family transcriptional regulator
MQEKGNSEPAFRRVWSDLRSQILNHEFDPDTALPTELDLAQKYSVSRQTVRRAFLDLVAEDLVFRVPGRGTFVTPPSKRYLRHFGSIEDLMSLSADTQLRVLHPLTTAIDPTAASRLRLSDDHVTKVVFLRFHQGDAFSYTNVYMPPRLGAQLAEVDELASPDKTTSVTLIGLLDGFLDSPIQDAEQSITVVTAPAEVAQFLDLPISTAMLRIDRMYFDSDGTPVELAISYYHPDRYSYRIRLRRNPL